MPIRPLLSSLCFVLAATACSGEDETEGPTDEERLALPADAVLGQRLFRQCAVCHDTQKDGDHRVGPNLWGVVGAEAGRHADFAYSRALMRSEVVWDETALDAYIKEPQGLIPGGRMGYNGNASAADRRDIIAYLSTKAD